MIYTFQIWSVDSLLSWYICISHNNFVFLDYEENDGWKVILQRELQNSRLSSKVDKKTWNG